MRSAFRLPLRFILLLIPATAFALPLFDRTTGWTEEVRFRTGEAVRVDRTLTFGPDAFFRPGQGGIHEQTLSFQWQKRRVRWTGEKVMPNAIPLTLDIVDGMPVIVMPVLGMRPCDEFGYPQEGLAAWRHQAGKWARIELKTLPPDLPVNLLQGYSLRPEGVVTAEWKRQYDRVGGRQRSPLVAAAGHTESEHACARIRPAPDPALDAAMAEVVRAEQLAGTVIAQRLGFTTVPETVSGADLRANLGAWKTVSWVAESCRELVVAAESRNNYTITPTSASSQLSGYLVKLKADARFAFRDSRMTIDNIACEGSTIVVVRRNAADRVLVDRFDRSGRVIDATWVQLPGAAEVATDSSWPPVWSVALQGSRLTIVLADYAYTRTMAEGGTLRRKAVYEARLPAI